MTLSRGSWVKQNGTVGLTAVELRRVDAACYYQTAPGVTRSGLLWVSNAGLALVTATAGWSYDLQAVPGLVIGRSANEGAYTLTTQGVTNVPTTAAPAAGLSRWDLIWIKQNDVEKGDADNLPVLGVTNGTAAASPTKPTASVPVGAYVLAEARIYAGTTGTSNGTNTLAQLWQYTALVGQPVPVRNTTERGTLSTPRPGDKIVRLDLPAFGNVEQWDGTQWFNESHKPFGHMGRTDGFQSVSAGGSVVGMSAAQVLRGGMTFDNASDSLVAPIAGFYRITMRGYLTGSTGYWAVVKSQANLADIQGSAVGQWKAESSDYMQVGSVSRALNAGDRVNIIVGGSNGAGSTWGTDGYNGTWLELEWTAP